MLEENRDLLPDGFQMLEESDAPSNSQKKRRKSCRELWCELFEEVAKYSKAHFLCNIIDFKDQLTVNLDYNIEKTKVVYFKYWSTYLLLGAQVNADKNDIPNFINLTDILNGIYKECLNKKDFNIVVPIAEKGSNESGCLKQTYQHFVALNIAYSSKTGWDLTVYDSRLLLTAFISEAFSGSNYHRHNTYITNQLTESKLYNNKTVAINRVFTNEQLDNYSCGEFTKKNCLRLFTANIKNNLNSLLEKNNYSFGVTLNLF